MKKLALLCLILALPTLSYGAITYDTAQTWEAEAGAGAGGNITIGSGSNRIVFICRSIRDSSGAVAADTSAPTVGGSPATQIGTGITNSGNVMRAELWYYLSPPSGSVAIATTPAASTDRNLTAAIAYSGVAQTSTFNTPNTQQTVGTDMDTDSIASALTDLVVQCGVQRRGTAAITASPDGTSPISTERVDVAHTQTTSSSVTFYEEAGAATSTDIRVDLSESVQWAAIGVAMRAAADAATFGPLRRR